MFISPPNNFNQTPMWNTAPMMPLSNLENFEDTRQKPVYPTTTDNQDFEIAPGAPTAQVANNILYNQGWLTTQIGKYIKIEFLIGTTMLIDREGILKEVGISYVVIEEAGTNDIVMCDIYSIKFVRVFSNQAKWTR